MRNPLNAICAMILKIKDSCSTFYELLRKSPKLAEKIRSDMKKCLQDIDFGTRVIETSSKILSFVVSDMLSLAQLNSDKFRKNQEIVDIKSAVEEVISL